MVKGEPITVSSGCLHNMAAEERDFIWGRSPFATKSACWIYYHMGL